MVVLASHQGHTVQVTDQPMLRQRQIARAPSRACHLRAGGAGCGCPAMVLSAGTGVFAQPVFAQQTLFVATETNGLYNFAP